jgi:AraC family transcriptional regulator of adaptative response/methylated-DNA-[protein]-cysteine methyltransferase
MDDGQISRDYQRIERALRYIEANVRLQPGLNEIAAHVGLSEFHFQRLFTQWAGITPKRFLQFLTKEHAKALLRRSENVLDASLAAGLSGPGRLHDLLVSCEAATPGELRAGGEGVCIDYGVHPTPFGDCLIATTARGSCHLAFVQDGCEAAIAALHYDWPHARLRENSTETRVLVRAIFNSAPHARPLPLLLKGTNFQLKVWEALLAIPPGAVVSYQAIARYIHLPNAARAVGTAIGQNRIAYLIPCHRVIRTLGDFGEYRWGDVRKKAILGWEVARSHEEKALAADE